MSEPKASHDAEIRIATYNVQRCRGMDRRTSPLRIAEVLREIDADVIVVRPPDRAAEQEPAIAAADIEHHRRRAAKERFPGELSLGR